MVPEIVTPGIGIDFLGPVLCSWVVLSCYIWSFYNSYRLYFIIRVVNDKINSFDAFSASPSLRMVNLSNNLLFSMEHFHLQPHIERIEIDNNPWDCAWLNKCRFFDPSLFEVFRNIPYFATQ
uniref:Uncharacterized protein n=1 Tax=Anopheles epiroticus TaxID=199890 RepID=A0A182PUG1_9DIPT